MTARAQLITRRDFIAAMGIGIAGSALALHGAKAAYPESNARNQPSTLNVVLYANKIDVDLRLAPFRAGTTYTLSVHSESQVFQGFAIENSNGETVASLQHVSPKQTATLDVTFPEAGDYEFISSSLGGYYLVPSYTTTKTITCEKVRS